MSTCSIGIRNFSSPVIQTQGGRVDQRQRRRCEIGEPTLEIRRRNVRRNYRRTLICTFLPDRPSGRTRLYPHPQYFSQRLILLSVRIRRIPRYPYRYCAQILEFLKGVTRAYGPRLALDDVNLALEPGELSFLVGPSGAGKTTLLKLINREIRPRQARSSSTAWRRTT